MNVIDEWINSDSAKQGAEKFFTACLMQGRSCGKTAFAAYQMKKYLEDHPDAQMAVITDKLYDTLGIKEYLNKIYGDPMLKFKNGNYINYDINLTNSDKLKELFKTPNIVDLVNQIERKEEKSMEYYTFAIMDLKGFRYEITIEKNFRNNDYPYRIGVHTLKDVLSTEKGVDSKIMASTFVYTYWEQLETQLMYDLGDAGIIVGKDFRDKITFELHRARRSFCGSSYANYDSPYRGGNNSPKPTMSDHIKKVVFNDPATIVIWEDGTKTVVKAQDGEHYDPEKGLAMAIAKKVNGNRHDYYNVFKKWLKKCKMVSVCGEDVKTLVIPTSIEKDVIEFLQWKDKERIDAEFAKSQAEKETEE